MEDLNLQKRITPLNAWAFSFGCLLGWGSFVMPATVFLPTGGVTGSLLAFLVGGLGVALIALNYHYLASLCKGVGGIFYLLQNTMGRGHAFTASWAICFAHMCIIPLNARALARLVKALFLEYAGIEFHVPFFNPSVLLIDFVVMTGVLLLFAWINAKGINIVCAIQTVLAITLFLGLVLLFFMAVLSGVPIPDKMSPGLYPGKGFGASFLTVYIMIPWAFVGFDSVPALSREARFPKRKLGHIMVLAVIAGTFGYIANIIITLLGVPNESWVEYVNSVGNLKGLDSIAVVYAARNLFGGAGTVIALITLLAGILSGPNGSIAMVSRLVFHMSRSNSLFPSLSKTNDRGVPYRSIYFVVIIAVVMILVANTFNTMEQVASLATAFAYGYCSLAAFLNAVKKQNRFYVITGGIGFLTCLVWFVFLIIPTALTGLEISLRTYVSMATWIFMGIWGYAYTCRKPDTILDD